MNLNSQKKYNTLYLILLFISLSSIISKNLNTFKFKYENKPVNYRINNSKIQQLIDIKFTSDSRSKYTKIFINENNSESNNYTISVFSDEKRTKSIQEYKIISGNKKLWLSEFQPNEKIYLNVECDKLPCNYILNISPEEKIKLNTSEQISYYTNEQNLEMTFVFDLKSVSKNEHMNIWAKGEFEIITKLVIENNVFEYEKNNLYSFKPGNYNGNELILKVTAKKGDFINVGSQIFEKNLAKNSSLIKDNPVINFLSENELKKSYYDYDLTEIDENYQNYNNKKNMTYTSEITLSNIDDKFKSQSILTENTDSENEHFLTFEINSNYTNNVTLLKKSNMETFFIIENTPRFYYLNVSSGEVLSIIINFNRGSEKIYCKLVNSSIDPFDVSQYPKSSEDYINYDSYLKKIEYFIDDDECENGCYILITAATDTKNYKELVRNFTFSISTYYDSLFETIDIPPVNISSDEYIIGDIAYNEDYLSNQLYYIQIQNNTDEIIIDLQSNEAYICIKIGNQKFQPANADFKFFPYDKNSVFSINKTEIINKAKEKKYDIYNNDDNSLKDFGLTIGLLTKNYDSVYTTVYAFLIHLKKDETKYDIYKVNFDQTTLCNTTKISNNETYPYRCLYIIYPETYSNYTDLLVYANSQNESIEYQIYADYLEIEEYNDDIEKKIPNINSKFSTNKTKLNYIYLNEGLNNKYLFVSVVSKTNTTIQLMTSFYSIEKEMSVNPNTPQLFIMNNEKLELEFNNNYNNFAINLMSFSGEAEIFWSNENNNKYYLRGREDRLSFFCKMDNNKLIINNLNTKNNTKDNEIPGLAFYLNYELKSVKNFDETQFGKSVTFEYVNSQLPLDIYTKLPNYGSNISIFFSFYNIEPEDYNKYMNNKINIKAGIITQATVYNVKSDPSTSVNRNNLIQGVYDPGLRVGFLRLTEENFAGFNISESDKPNLYVTIIDENTNENVRYTKISLKMTVIQENSLVQTSENVYQYGSLSTNKACVYKLKPYLQKPNMRIEFSSTDENIKYNISKSSENKNDGTIIVNREKNYNGRKLIDINADPENNDCLYLHIYREENDTKQEENLEGNFVFKYINYVEISNLKDYYISNSEIIASEENKTITLKFNAIPNSTFFNVTYIVKLIYSKDNTIKETIAFSSIGNVIKVKEYKNPNVDEGNINLEIQNKEDANYVVIHAIINDKSINEYVSYKVSKIKKTENKTGHSSSTSTIIMVIVILLITVSVILVISLFLFSKKNKDLMYKVNKLSFKTDERTSGLEGDTLYKNI